MRFQRIQFTPDLMPSDVTGSSIYDQRAGDFEFRPGPIFANLLLGDEINRAPPKTQAALLEAMQERQVTIEGATHPLEPPFLVIATQNPIEYEGTYPLPEAQLDRFLLRLGVGYPEREDEWRMLERPDRARADEVELERVVDRQTLLAMQRAIEQVHVSESDRLLHRRPRRRDARRAARSQVGASPRGSLALLKLVARAAPRSSGATSSRPRTSRRSPCPALAHRLMLRPELWVRRVRPEDVVATRSTRCRRRQPEDARPTSVTRGATREARRLHAASPRSRSSSARARACPSSSRVGAPFALVVALGLLVERRPDCRRHARAPTASGCSRARRSSVELDVRGLPTRGRALRPAPATGSSSWTARTRCARLGGDEVVTLRAAGDALGRVPPRRSSTSARTTGFGVCPLGDAARPPHAAEGLPARGVPAHARRARCDAGLRGQPGRAREGRRDRVRRPPPVRRRRPRAPRELARERAARRALGQRVPPGAEHRRDPLRRLVRRGAARRARRRSTRACARRRRSPARYLREKDRVGSISFGGTLNWLLPATGLVQLYRIVDAVLDSRDRPQLRVAQPRRRPAPHAAAARARARGFRRCSTSARPTRCSTSARAGSTSR